MFDLTLSFDNGPEPGVTPGVLDALGERGIKASFFVVGEKLRANRAIVERAHAEDHWIANHTWTHRVPLGDRQQDSGIESEIEPTQQELGDLAHQRKFFRPFANGVIGPRLLNRQSATYLRDQNYSCVLWNLVGGEWNDPDDWVERVADECREHAWTLLVLHDLPNGAMKHLPRFLDRVAKLGARFRQDFPPDCVPIRDGKLAGKLAPYVAGGWDDSVAA